MRQKQISEGSLVKFRKQYMMALWLWAKKKAHVCSIMTFTCVRTNVTLYLLSLDKKDVRFCEYTPF